MPIMEKSNDDQSLQGKVNGGSMDGDVLGPVVETRADTAADRRPSASPLSLRYTFPLPLLHSSPCTSQSLPMTRTDPLITLSSLERADGSASYSNHGYSVICGVNGPVEVQRRDELPEEAAIEVNIRPASGAGGMSCICEMCRTVGSSPSRSKRTQS